MPGISKHSRSVQAGEGYHGMRSCSMIHGINTVSERERSYRTERGACAYLGHIRTGMPGR